LSIDVVITGLLNVIGQFSQAGLAERLSSVIGRFRSVYC